MTQFTGLVVQDQEGHPEEFSEQAAKQIAKTVTEPIQIIPSPSGKFFVRVK